MKKLFAVSLLTTFIFTSCFVFDFEGDQGSRKFVKKDKSALIASFVKNANFDVSNLLLLRNTADYRGKVLGLSGSLVEQLYSNDKDHVLEIRGKTGDRGFDIIIRLDHPAKKQFNIGEDITTLGTGAQVRMIVQFAGFEDFMDEYGSKRKLPVADCIAIFQHKDYAMSDPIWVWEK